MTHAIRIHQYGGPEVLTWEEVRVDAPGPGLVRIRQTAIGLNYIDTYHRTGLYKVPALPCVPGVEAAGVVEAIGDEVNGLAIGDRVAYAGPLGGYAESRLVPADRLVLLPPSISDRQAAAMMLQGMTAAFLLHQTFAVRPGDAILVHAAAGGVGLILCQWAKTLGATVIGAVGSPAKADLVAAHGCAHPILYTQESFVDRVREITNGAGVAAVYDGVGRSTFMGSLDCLKPRGTMILYGQASGPVEPFDPGLLATKGSLFLTRPTLFTYAAHRADLLNLAKLLFDVVAQGHVRVDIHQSFALCDAAEAHRALESRATVGSTILLP
ncbi:Quinone oxidoreductase [Azospirillaceae bacterium]